VAPQELVPHDEAEREDNCWPGQAGQTLLPRIQREDTAMASFATVYQRCGGSLWRSGRMLDRLRPSPAWHGRMASHFHAGGYRHVRRPARSGGQSIRSHGRLPRFLYLRDHPSRALWCHRADCWARVVMGAALEPNSRAHSGIFVALRAAYRHYLGVYTLLTLLPLRLTAPDNLMGVRRDEPLLGGR
jgi:hypothetical protein